MVSGKTISLIITRETKDSQKNAKNKKTCDKC
jgi:hypothetical protein